MEQASDTSFGYLLVPSKIDEYIANEKKKQPPDKEQILKFLKNLLSHVSPQSQNFSSISKQTGGENPKPTALSYFASPPSSDLSQITIEHDDKKEKRDYYKNLKHKTIFEMCSKVIQAFEFSVEDIESLPAQFQKILLLFLIKLEKKQQTSEEPKKKGPILLHSWLVRAYVQEKFEIVQFPDHDDMDKIMNNEFFFVPSTTKEGDTNSNKSLPEFEDYLRKTSIPILVEQMLSEGAISEFLVVRIMFDIGEFLFVSGHHAEAKISFEKLIEWHEDKQAKHSKEGSLFQVPEKVDSYLKACTSVKHFKDLNDSINDPSIPPPNLDKSLMELRSLINRWCEINKFNVNEEKTQENSKFSSSCSPETERENSKASNLFSLQHFFALKTAFENKPQNDDTRAEILKMEDKIIEIFYSEIFLTLNIGRGLKLHQNQEDISKNKTNSSFYLPENMHSSSSLLITLKRKEIKKNNQKFVAQIDACCFLRDAFAESFKKIQNSQQEIGSKNNVLPTNEEWDSFIWRKSRNLGFSTKIEHNLTFLFYLLVFSDRILTSILTQKVPDGFSISNFFLEKSEIFTIIKTMLGTLFSKFENILPYILFSSSGNQVFFEINNKENGNIEKKVVSLFYREINKFIPFIKIEKGANHKNYLKFDENLWQDVKIQEKFLIQFCDIEELSSLRSILIPFSKGMKVTMEKVLKNFQNSFPDEEFMKTIHPLLKLSGNDEISTKNGEDPLISSTIWKSSQNENENEKQKIKNPKKRKFAESVLSNYSLARSLNLCENHENNEDLNTFSSFFEEDEEDQNQGKHKNSKDSSFLFSGATKKIKLSATESKRLLVHARNDLFSRRFQKSANLFKFALSQQKDLEVPTQHNENFDRSFEFDITILKLTQKNRTSNELPRLTSPIVNSVEFEQLKTLVEAGVQPEEPILIELFMQLIYLNDWGFIREFFNLLLNKNLENEHKISEITKSACVFALRVLTLRSLFTLSPVESNCAIETEKNEEKPKNFETDDQKMDIDYEENDEFAENEPKNAKQIEQTTKIFFDFMISFFDKSALSEFFGITKNSSNESENLQKVEECDNFPGISFLNSDSMMKDAMFSNLSSNSNYATNSNPSGYIEFTRERPGTKFFSVNSEEFIFRFINWKYLNLILCTTDVSCIKHAIIAFSWAILSIISLMEGTNAANSSKFQKTFNYFNYFKQFCLDDNKSFQFSQIMKNSFKELLDIWTNNSNDLINSELIYSCSFPTTKIPQNKNKYEIDEPQFWKDKELLFLQISETILQFLMESLSNMKKTSNQEDKNLDFSSNFFFDSQENPQTSSFNSISRKEKYLSKILLSEMAIMHPILLWISNFTQKNPNSFAIPVPMSINNKIQQTIPLQMITIPKRFRKLSVSHCVSSFEALTGNFSQISQSFIEKETLEKLISNLELINCATPAFVFRQFIPDLYYDKRHAQMLINFDEKWLKFVWDSAFLELFFYVAHHLERNPNKVAKVKQQIENQTSMNQQIDTIKLEFLRKLFEEFCCSSFEL